MTEINRTQTKGGKTGSTPKPEGPKGSGLDKGAKSTKERVDEQKREING
jgi:hypothetical protein